ncbi:MAG: ASKHA domain-containing protein [Desulfovibrionaceae bacterium]
MSQPISQPGPAILARTADGRALTLAPAPGRTLAQVLFLAGVWAEVPLCAGLGRCGLCRVRFVSPPPAARADEVRRLGATAVAQGWRLSCLHPAEACEIELPRPVRAAPRVAGHPRRETRPGDLALAVDLGTTSLHWSLLRVFPRGGGFARLAAGRELNPQMGLGGEVMSRLALAASPEGLALLRGLVLDRLRGLVRSLSDDAGAPVTRLAVAGNSAMLSILTGRDAPGLRAAPYRLDWAAGEETALAPDTHPDLPPALLPPLLAPFVGADLSAGLAALHFTAPEAGGAPDAPWLLLDLGTNGEFVLCLPDGSLLGASVPMGPALEGVGLSLGRTAGPGAVVRYDLTPAGLTPRLFEDQPARPGDAPGLTGTGYLSLTARLLQAGLLARDGRFAPPGPDAPPLARRLGRALVRGEGGEPRLVLPGGQGGELELPASDVEELLKVKAACNMAIARLLAEAGLRATDLRSLQLAGALGEHADPADLAELGFIPPSLPPRTVKAGNTSLRGAELLLARPEARTWTAALPGRFRVLDLTDDPDFQTGYLARMHFTYVP